MEHSHKGYGYTQNIYNTLRRKHILWHTVAHTGYTVDRVT